MVGGTNFNVVFIGEILIFPFQYAYVAQFTHIIKAASKVYARRINQIDLLAGAPKAAAPDRRKPVR
jgi:hypothetical protein